MDVEKNVCRDMHRGKVGREKWAVGSEQGGEVVGHKKEARLRYNVGKMNEQVREILNDIWMQYENKQIMIDHYTDDIVDAILESDRNIPDINDDAKRISSRRANIAEVLLAVGPLDEEHVQLDAEALAERVSKIFPVLPPPPCSKQLSLSTSTRRNRSRSPSSSKSASRSRSRTPIRSRSMQTQPGSPSRSADSPV